MLDMYFLRGSKKKGVYGSGYTLIFSYIGSGHFLGVQNFEFQYFWGFSEKTNTFGGMKILWIFFFFFGGGGVITNLDYI